MEEGTLPWLAVELESQLHPPARKVPSVPNLPAKIVVFMSVILKAFKFAFTTRMMFFV